MRIRRDIKKKYDNFLRLYSSDFLLIKANRNYRCSCFNEVTKESNRECKSCFGLGYQVAKTIYSGRAEDASMPESLAVLLKNKSVGDVSTAGRRHFLTSDFDGEEKDLLVGVSIGKDGALKYDGDGIWRINHVDRNNKTTKDNTIFKVSFSTETPVSESIRGEAINQITEYEDRRLL
ncbi:MAG: hypothetical protein ACRC5C_04910 [Bacilli bacterium]